jgi:gas vesicle protein
MSRFMTGLLMGVGLGVLLAPEKGVETRESLAETAGELKDKFNRLVGRAGARMDDLKSMLDNGVEGLSDDVRSRIRTILDEDAGGAASNSRTSSSYSAATAGSTRGAGTDLAI